MSYDNQILRVCRLENGFEVEVYEPPPPPKKSKKDSTLCGCGPYEEPWKAYAFETAETAIAFMAAKMPSMTRKSGEEEYQETFKEATK